MTMPLYNIDEDTFRAWLQAQDEGASWPRWNCRLCPLADYIQSQSGSQAARVEVGGDAVVTIDGILHWLPEWTTCFVVAFDGPARSSAYGLVTDALRALDVALWEVGDGHTPRHPALRRR